jgi:hypothetical protein
MILAAAGGVSAYAPRYAADRFWGLITMLFFGLCAWVFFEEAAGGPLSSKQRRFPWIVGLAGLLSIAVSLTVGGVRIGHRIGIAALGSLLVAACARAAQNARARSGPRR